MNRRRGPEPCEYNPVLMRPATDPPSKGDCAGFATISIGRNGAWHLCSECAMRPEFKRYKVRREINIRSDSRSLKEGGHGK